MSLKRTLMVATPAALAIFSALYAAAPNTFAPDWTFKGSALGTLKTVGQADWKAENGELVGTPKAASGGWLVLDKSLQDAAFFGSFRCAPGCKTGVLMRMQKTATGLQGVYVSLTEGELATYAVKLDAQGVETARERLKPAGGQYRFAEQATQQNPPVPGFAPARAGRGPAPAAAAGGGRGRGPAGPGGPGRGGPSLKADWNTLEVRLDANIVRPVLNGAQGFPGGDTADDQNGYGPIALYVGGTGEVRFKDVSTRDLQPKIEPEEQVSSHFRMQRLSDFDYGWSAAAADINHDGIPDIVSGPFYYLGPQYTERHEFTSANTYNPSTTYPQAMVIFAADFNGDGWPDILAADSRPMYLYINPKGESRRWDRFPVMPSVTTEIVLQRDMDGDGKPAIVYGGGGVYAYAKPDPANPTGPWTVHAVSSPTGPDAVPVNIHGLGAGAVNGDGRMDIVAPAGWFEHPPKGASGTTPEGPWKFHPANFGAGGAEMAVYDVNGDGLADIVTTLQAHLWGISWFEQKKDGTFVEHAIMGDQWTKNAGGVTFSEPHGSTFADIDGDGIPDFIVGKRHWAHLESYTDPDPYGAAVLYVYRTVRNPKAPGGAEFVPELIHNRSGAGSHLIATDLNKDGAIDIVTSVNRGTFVFWGKKGAWKK